MSGASAWQAFVCLSVYWLMPVSPLHHDREEIVPFFVIVMPDHYLALLNKFARLDLLFLGLIFTPPAVSNF
jgi:hypothetical protein